jgi:hypothetical protein
LSYFAKPNFIIYDEWFDDDLEKNKLDVKNKKIKNISKIHEFFYEQSNYKVGASENNLQLEIKVNEKQIITNNYFKKSLEKYTSTSHKKISFINKLKFSMTKKLMYSLSILSFLLIFGFVLLFISSSKKSASNSFIILEKEF